MSADPSQASQISLFPLKVVVFPGGKLDLQIFEQRYIDLIKQSLRDESGFGICLLKSGEEVVSKASRQTIHRSGTLVTIRDWDLLENGLLGITVEGLRKFRVQECWQADSGVLQARVLFSETDDVKSEAFAIGDEFSGLVELLQNLGNHPMVEQRKIAVDYENLLEVGWRLSELIPIEVDQRQQLLELDDPHQRILAIEQIVSEIANGS